MICLGKKEYNVFSCLCSKRLPWLCSKDRSETIFYNGLSKVSSSSYLHTTTNYSSIVLFSVLSKECLSYETRKFLSSMRSLSQSALSRGYKGRMLRSTAAGKPNSSRENRIVGRDFAFDSGEGFLRFKLYSFCVMLPMSGRCLTPTLSYIL